ncbi:hypothetical protein PR048_020663 [Dryococelus australis]|uniref:FP protein C-terminal domain-containing protein n=1 Tax=Dryococelus australis TaxID=614101 RepID=A0ABQ9H732_9NEOP|nr:hypothetical protein PR048_020663 [Dryococelus australis]
MSVKVIDACHLLPQKHSELPLTINVKLLRKKPLLWLKDLFTSMRTLHHTLHKKIRDFKKQGLKFVWIRNGCIFAKMNEASRTTK